MSRPETILSTGGLPDRELGDRPRRRGLTFVPRQRRADQRPMHGPFFLVAAIVRELRVFGAVHALAGLRRQLRLLVEDVGRAT